jgi:hypothetical protein
MQISYTRITLYYSILLPTTPPGQLPAFCPDENTRKSHQINRPAYSNPTSDVRTDGHHLPGGSCLLRQAPSETVGGHLEGGLQHTFHVGSLYVNAQQRFRDKIEKNLKNTLKKSASFILYLTIACKFSLK